jgi:hypothetical protein
MADDQIIPYGMDLYQPAPDKDSLALVPVEDPVPLSAIPPKQRPRSYGQSYFAQVCQPALPSPLERLLLEDAPPKGPTVKLLRDVKLLPPKPNETLMGVKLDKLGQDICAKYTTATPRTTTDGIRANPMKVKFIPPKDVPKRAPPPQSQAPKRQRNTITELK